MIFHYIPLGLLAVSLAGFYIGAVIFPPCKNIFDFESETCDAIPCYLEVSWLNICDYMIHGVIRIVIEAICSVSLLIRVIWQKYRAHQPIRWRNYRKMTIQLLSISSLSLSIIFPQTLLIAIQQTIPGMENFASVALSYLYYLEYFVILLSPLVSLACLPELWLKLIPFIKRNQ